jgi:hypothetical protein
MGDEYLPPDKKHSALLIIDVQRDFTLIGAVAETHVCAMYQAIPLLKVGSNYCKRITFLSSKSKIINPNRS